MLDFVKVDRLNNYIKLCKSEVLILKTGPVKSKIKSPEMVLILLTYLLNLAIIHANRLNITLN